MPDPEMISRADRAAAALAGAWERWCIRHELAAGSRAQVASYVGYSIDEPGGQPRVVLGVDADEAEYLATLLDGHEFAPGARARPGRRAYLPKPIPPADVPTGPGEEPAATVPADDEQPAGDIAAAGLAAPNRPS
jgi:hypothetical protein